jgi:hypothetical protein
MTDRNYNPTADNVVALANDMKQMIGILAKTVEDLGKLLLATPPPNIPSPEAPKSDKA